MYLLPPQGWERAEEVDALNIEDLNFKDEVKGHLILPW